MMTRIRDNIIRAAALGAILVAGSCAVQNGADSIAEDGAVNHPISIEPSFRDIKLTFTGGQDGISADEAAKFDNFLADYRAHGNGSLGISAPNGAPSHAAITYFAERAAQTGISRDKILVSTHDAANGDARIDVSYITYSAHTDTCGDWSENLAFSIDNLTPKNFGCASQHKIAAMVADPRDLIGPRRMDTADAVRGGTVINAYEQGKVTQAEKKIPDASVEQSAPGSDVGSH
jgi:pilus assembly protein CpaD